ncbi:PREDICTED: B-lymphocyte antigen CD20-like [Propithecus coquereli]|uniref:B-lymphocyte antigen CD20-like n=1 Tax=Propithecus coquereli TaxID=379532 RepID=UPI00063EFB9F|nr:PREDICTED: B-lymphocyte antigen CD20-like [Propithecus coquereli]
MTPLFPLSPTSPTPLHPLLLFLQYIISGSLLAAAEKNSRKSLAKGKMIMNSLSLFAAISGMILSIMDILNIKISHFLKMESQNLIKVPMPYINIYNCEPAGSSEKSSPSMQYCYTIQSVFLGTLSVMLIFAFLQELVVAGIVENEWKRTCSRPKATRGHQEEATSTLDDAHGGNTERSIQIHDKRSFDSKMTTPRNSVNGTFPAEPMKGPIAVQPVQKVTLRRMSTPLGPTQSFFMRESKAFGAVQIMNGLFHIALGGLLMIPTGEYAPICVTVWYPLWGGIMCCCDFIHEKFGSDIFLKYVMETELKADL